MVTLSDFLEKGGLFRISGFDHAAEPSTCCKLSRDFRPVWAAGPNHVVKDAVDSIFVENTDVSVRVNVHFQRLELEAMFLWLVVQRDGSKVRQIRFGADGCIFRNDDRDFVSGILIGKRLNVGQRGRNSAPRMPLVVAEPGRCGFGFSFVAGLSSHAIPLRRYPHTCFIHSNCPISFSLLYRVTHGQVMSGYTSQNPPLRTPPQGP